jgi:hypothetical protein
MRRLSMLLGFALFLAGCGTTNSSSVSQVTVTVLRGGVVVPDSPVVASAGIDDTVTPPVPTGVIATQNTNASGQTVFAVPSSTTTGVLCFSSYVSLGGGFEFDAECHLLNSLPGTIQLEHY